VAAVSRVLFLAAGAVLVAVGLVWTLQGLGYVSGSPMTGVTLWAILGPITGLLGVGLAVKGFRG